MLLKLSRPIYPLCHLAFSPNLLKLHGLLTPCFKFKISYFPNVPRIHTSVIEDTSNRFDFTRAVRRTRKKNDTSIPWRRKVVRQQWDCPRHCWDVRQLSVRRCHISRTADYVVFSRSRARARARSNDSLVFESKQGVLQRCIPWRCSVFSLGVPFFATRAKRATAAVVVAATLRTGFVFSQSHSIRSTGAILWILSIHFSEYISETSIVPLIPLNCWSNVCWDK